MKSISKFTLFSLLFFSSFFSFYPTQCGTTVQNITIGGSFHPKFRWGGNMDDITRGLVVGITGFIVDGFIDCAIKQFNNQPIQFDKTELAYGLAKVSATVGLGSGGGLVAGLAETTYKMGSAPILALSKLAAYSVAILLVQGKLAE